MKLSPFLCTYIHLFNFSNFPFLPYFTVPYSTISISYSIHSYSYQVEYCAASDALTFAPEGFNEFFNQRRRWVPSTLANIIDLLRDHRNVVKVNESISIWWDYCRVLFRGRLIFGILQKRIPRRSVVRIGSSKRDPEVEIPDFKHLARPGSRNLTWILNFYILDVEKTPNGASSSI